MLVKEEKKKSTKTFRQLFYPNCSGKIEKKKGNLKSDQIRYAAATSKKQHQDEDESRRVKKRGGNKERDEDAHASPKERKKLNEYKEIREESEQTKKGIQRPKTIVIPSTNFVRVEM